MKSPIKETAKKIFNFDKIELIEHKKKLVSSLKSIKNEIELLDEQLDDYIQHLDYKEKEFDVFDKLYKGFPNDEVKKLSWSKRDSAVILNIKSKDTAPSKILIHHKKSKQFRGSWMAKLNSMLLSNSFGIIVYNRTVPYDSREYKRIIVCMPEELVCTVGAIKKLLAIDAIKSK